MFSQIVESFQSIISSLQAQIDCLYDDLEYYKNYFYQNESFLESQSNFGIVDDHLEYNGHKFTAIELHKILEDHLSSSRSVPDESIPDDEWHFSSDDDVANMDDRTFAGFVNPSNVYINDIKFHREDPHFCAYKGRCYHYNFLCGNSRVVQHGSIKKCGHLATLPYIDHKCFGTSDIYFKNKDSRSHNASSWAAIGSECSDGNSYPSWYSYDSDCCSNTD